MELSVIVPAYNEQESLPRFLPRLEESLSECVGDKYEIIFVNDGSKDDTLRILIDKARSDKRIRVLNLSRNFGKEIAITAGLHISRGRASLMLDADGQHPPELIPKFYKLWKKDNMVVIGVRETEQEGSTIKRLGSKFFYKIINSMGDFTMIPGSTDYRLIDEKVREEFIKFTEHNRIARGLIDWMGFPYATVSFKTEQRLGGTATYSMSKLFKLALNSFVSLSMLPLYLIGYIGIFISGSSLILGLAIFIEQILLNDPLHINVTGTAMLGVLTIFLVGIILCAQGLLALYLSHIHVQAQNRPLFIVDKRHSVNIEVEDI